MAGQRRSNTTPELLLRRELHARGLRYRVGYKVPGLLRRTIDIAFTRSKLAVFIDGCFWHHCPEHYVPVKKNSEWWESKLRRNVERDKQTAAALVAVGWRVLRVWEHESPISAADRVERTFRKGMSSD